ncbi:MAG: hypothetical protein H6539_03180 [Bacteroidales bacterium]|nr:hypothetical protein [Bacteroidales bacterium]
MILFFMVIFAFSDKSVVKDSNIAARQEIISEIQSHDIKAVAVNPVQLPVFQIKWITFIDNVNFRFSDISLGTSSENNKIRQKYIFLKKQQLIIKPKLIAKFYYRMFSSDSPELPVLS